MFSFLAGGWGGGGCLTARRIQDILVILHLNILVIYSQWNNYHFPQDKQDNVRSKISVLLGRYNLELTSEQC